MITKDDLIIDVVSKYPESVEVFLDYGLWCVWCTAASFESIGDWATNHWLQEEEIKMLIADLNSFVKPKAKSWKGSSKSL